MHVRDSLGAGEGGAATLGRLERPARHHVEREARMHLLCTGPLATLDRSMLPEGS